MKHYGRTIEDPAERFAVYCEEFDRWKERLGLQDWDVSHRRVPAIESKLAEVSFNLAGRTALTSLCDDTGILESNKQEMTIRSTAFHEACHLLLATLNCMAEEYVAEVLVDREIHAVINKLEANIFVPDWQARERACYVKDFNRMNIDHMVRRALKEEGECAE